MFSALRIFRVLRVFKVISGERQMRVILDAIFRAIPGIAWAAGVMALIYARLGFYERQSQWDFSPRAKSASHGRLFTSFLSAL